MFENSFLSIQNNHQFQWVDLISKLQSLFTAATLEGGGAEIADTSCLADVGDTFREARSIQHQITGNVTDNNYQRSLLVGQSTILEIDRLRKKFEVRMRESNNCYILWHECKLLNSWANL